MALTDFNDQTDDTEDTTPTSLSALQGVLAGQRASVSNLYDKITQNIMQRYRQPGIGDLLLAVGTGMMTPPGENDRGGFAGSVQRGLQGIGTYAKQRTDYKDKLNEMLSQIDVKEATDLADLEQKYLPAAAAAMKPRVTRPVGTETINGKLYAISQDPDTGNFSKTELGDAPAALKPIPGVTSNQQPVFMGLSGPVDALGNPVAQFDVKPKAISATEQRQMWETEDTINSGLGNVASLEQALALNQQALEGSLTGWKKSLGQLFSSDDPQYVATESFDNLVSTGALQSLKSTFGGNPTEGERKILMDLQAISSKPRAVRDQILRRALEAAKLRISRETQRLERLKGGDYSTRGGSPANEGRVIRYDKTGKRI